MCKKMIAIVITMLALCQASIVSTKADDSIWSGIDISDSTTMQVEDYDFDIVKYPYDVQSFYNDWHTLYLKDVLDYYIEDGLTFTNSNAKVYIVSYFVYHKRRYTTSMNYDVKQNMIEQGYIMYSDSNFVVGNGDVKQTDNGFYYKVLNLGSDNENYKDNILAAITDLPAVVSDKAFSMNCNYYFKEDIAEQFIVTVQDEIAKEIVEKDTGYKEFTSENYHDMVGYAMDENGNVISSQPLKSPSDSVIYGLNCLDSQFATPLIGSELYFYPDEIAGCTLVINYTYNFDTTVQRIMSATEKIKHPTYVINSSKAAPTLSVYIQKEYNITIPDDYTTLPEYDGMLVGETGVYYSAASNKIVVRHEIAKESVKTSIEEFVKNYELKIGKATCFDCYTGEKSSAKNYYAHIGNPNSILANCVLSRDRKTAQFELEYQFTAKSNWSSGTSSYSDITNNTRTSEKGINDSIIYRGTEKDGTENGYYEYMQISADDLINNDNDYANLSFSDSVTFVKSLLKSMKSFPSFVAEFFSYLPLNDVIAMLLSVLIILALAISAIKIVL